ncbi:MAG: hypothetical protein ACFFC7_34610 [Candidatus Hermodarchaeota archaeon]
MKKREKIQKTGNIITLTSSDGSKLKCYLCKREENSKTVYFVNNKQRTKEIKLQDISIELGGNLLNYKLCDECWFLLSESYQLEIIENRIKKRGEIINAMLSELL